MLVDKKITFRELDRAPTGQTPDISEQPLTAEELGRQLNVRRKEKYRSAEEAAEDFGISVSALHRWENATVPFPRHAKVVAEKLRWPEFIGLVRALRPKRKTRVKRTPNTLKMGF